MEQNAAGLRRAEKLLELCCPYWVTLDRRLDIVAISAALRSHLEFPAGGPIGANWIELAFQPRLVDTARAAFSAVWSGTHGKEFDLPLGRKAGTPQTMHWVCALDAGEQDSEPLLLCCGHAVESSHSVQIDADRLMRVSVLASLGEMLAGIAHEINQPLTSIVNYARACERFLALSPPDLEESAAAAHEIGTEALRAGAIILQLRRLFRGGDLDSEPAEIGKALSELQGLIKVDVSSRGVHIEYDIQPGLPAVQIGHLQLVQICINLLRNAVDATSGQQDPVGRILVRASLQPSHEVELRFADNGRGIEPADVGRLFEPFFSTKASGTGLGLPMCRTLIEAHGGSIRFEPTGARGACFIVTLPGVEFTP